MLKKIIFMAGCLGCILCGVAPYLKLQSYKDIMLFISVIPMLVSVLAYVFMPFGVFAIAFWHKGKKAVGILLWFSFALSLFPLFMQLFGGEMNALITALKSKALIYTFSALDLLSLFAVGAALFAVKGLARPAKIINFVTGAVFFAYAVYQGMTYVYAKLPSMHPYDFIAIFGLLAVAFFVRAFFPEKPVLIPAPVFPPEPEEAVVTE